MPDPNINTVLVRYGIMPDADVRALKDTVHIIGGRYILKRYADPAVLRRSAACADALTAHGLPAAVHARTPDGALCVTIENAHYALMPLLPGATPDPFEGNPRAWGVLLGRTVQRIHASLAGCACEAEQADDASSLTGWIAEELERHALSPGERARRTLEGFAPLYRALPRALIHRDAHPDNLLFTGDTLTGVIDFDLAQYNVRIFDLCYLCSALLVGRWQERSLVERWRVIAAGVFAGYAECAPLTPEEHAAAPLVLLYIEVLFAAFFARAGQIETARSCTAMADWISENVTHI